MAADLSSDGSVETRSVYMSALTISEKLGNFVGFSIGFWMLTWVLENYFYVWIVFTSGCICVFLAVGGGIS